MQLWQAYSVGDGGGKRSRRDDALCFGAEGLIFVVRVQVIHPMVQLYTIGVHATYFLDGPEAPIIQIVFVDSDVVSRAHRLVLGLAGGAQVHLWCLSALVCCCYSLLPLPGMTVVCPVAFLAIVVALALAVPAIAPFEGAGSGKGLVWSLWHALVLALPLALSQVFHRFDAVSFLTKYVNDIYHVFFFFF